jgi:gluconolactonase
MFAAPPCLEAEIFTRIPGEFLVRRGASSWAKRVLAQDHVDSFLEGPSFDRDGNLWVVDIPWGRLFKIDPRGSWSLAHQYDGEPNGLKFHRNGHAFIADHRRGLLEFDPVEGALLTLLDADAPNNFKGLNDLHFADNGDVWFTDQGQSGLHDPTGRLLLRRPDGSLGCLLDNIPSPNGLVLDNSGRSLLLAVTRDNAIWRVPLRGHDEVGRVGRFIQMSGGVGPDGLAMDQDGNLAVCHPGLGCVWLVNPAGEPILRINSPTGKMTTNCAFGGADGRTLYITESETGSILRANCPAAGTATFGLID